MRIAFVALTRVRRYCALALPVQLRRQRAWGVHACQLRACLIADFNGDGRPDAFVADHGMDGSPWPGYQNTLILSASGGKLVDATANLPQVYDFTHSAAAADVNGDGAVDLYVGNVYGANMVPPRILLNDGTGHFTVATGLLPAAQADLNQTQYTGSAFADVNGDAHPDLILSAEVGTPQSVVLINDGTGHFTLSRTLCRRSRSLRMRLASVRSRSTSTETATPTC